jgi:predicted PP-loop superfamily ATPase
LNDLSVVANDNCDASKVSAEQLASLCVLFNQESAERVEELTVEPSFSYAVPVDRESVRMPPGMRRFH